MQPCQEFSATLLNFLPPSISVGAGLLDLEGFWKQSRTPDNYLAILLVREMGKLKLFQVYNYLRLSPRSADPFHKINQRYCTPLIDRQRRNSDLIPTSSKDHIHSPLTHFTQSR